MYSIICINEKIIPNLIVKNNLIFLSFILFLIKLKWDHVIENPDEIKIIVLRRGISKGLNKIIPLGGHMAPISILGERAIWK